MKQSNNYMTKYDSWIIRSLGVFVPIMTYVLFTMLMSMTAEIRHLEDTKAEKINALSAMQYLAIEKGRSEVVSELFVSFGINFMGVREEELEPFRITALRKLNRSIKIGTTRGK